VDPKHAVRRLREHDVLLPGATTLARLVAQVRDDANHRLWDTLHGLLTSEQRALLETLTKVPEGERVTQLEKWRRLRGRRRRNRCPAPPIGADGGIHVA
jgi:hypothetical protein